VAGQAEAVFARSHFLGGLGRILGVPPAMRTSLTSRAELPRFAADLTGRSSHTWNGCMEFGEGEEEHGII